MASDYLGIRRENEARYGTDIGRIGPMLLAERYSERTHFIYELLQNAEDALARRGDGWCGNREVKFVLKDDALEVSHCGAPFNEKDVRSICGIADSTKGDTEIGRFGIGFKSVYAFTDRPEIHSGDEDFLIEHFVWPCACAPQNRGSDETLFVLPLRAEDTDAAAEITAGLHQLGPRVLLFLREIEEISWRTSDGASGQYLRSSQAHRTCCGAQRVELLWQDGGKEQPTDESWLVFSKPTSQTRGGASSDVEIAFRLTSGNGSGEAITQADDSSLVVFFPTVVETHLGFLAQGPYRTTPSRDNVPREDPWNASLVSDTAGLLVEALMSLRDSNLLDANALQALPMDSARFGPGRMFSPLFDAVREAFRKDSLLPCHDGGYAPAPAVRLARSGDLRELIGGDQMGGLFGTDTPCNWLSADITQDRTPGLRRYLIDQLDVTEVTPETLLSRLTGEFLESQNEQWIISLYEFLQERPSLRRRLADIPIVRLSDGSHVCAVDGRGDPAAFLPGKQKTSFPTASPTVCASTVAREFLKAIGLREADPVDDVVLNVLPAYSSSECQRSDSEYAADVDRMVTAFGTDSKSQRDRLVKELRRHHFVRAINAGDRSIRMARPTEVYLATQRLGEMFDGVAGVIMVDPAEECLRRESVRDLLEACGAVRHLRPVKVDADLSDQRLREMRREAGLERCTRYTTPSDYEIGGLKALLKAIALADPAVASAKAQMLWDALGDLEQRRGGSVFIGSYQWSYSHESRTAHFDAAFIHTLNTTSWIPSADGSLHTPDAVLFAETGWKENAFLLTKVRFRPPVVDQLAREAGLDPDLITALKTLGIASRDELVARLGLQDEEVPVPDETDEEFVDEDGHAGDGAGAGGIIRSGSAGGGGSSRPRTAPDGHGHEGRGGSGAKTTGPGHRPFISYVALTPNGDPPDPDGLAHEQRMALERDAIDFILTQEPDLRRTPEGNPGFDLLAVGLDELPVRWIEVKAMTGSLTDRSVGMSQAQFREAQRRGECYWLYIVEHAGEPSDRRILCIQDPAEKARTFLFDRGWEAIAESGPGD